MIKLRLLKKEISYEKDEHGKFKVVNDKYVLKITKNVVVLNFFSTTCIPCIREIPTYNKLAEHYKTKKWTSSNGDTWKKRTSSKNYYGF